VDVVGAYTVAEGMRIAWKTVRWERRKGSLFWRRKEQSRAGLWTYARRWMDSFNMTGTSGSWLTAQRRTSDGAMRGLRGSVQ